ncbi:unnamed protein product [Rhizoctonia solani]|uniref:Uncharacterized protein n=1 Tax=Rhizoctonia solani TaxID=456999 RepID=A0A8H3B8P8_9AGAM|nr:unnamed protein product [Rhizoctonia solani]
MITQFFMRPEREQPAPNPNLGEMAVLRLVNDLATKQGIIIDYIREQRGQDDKPLWVVKPKILGEVQPLEGSGLTVQAAKNTCALAILKTKRLVSLA